MRSKVVLATALAVVTVILFSRVFFCDFVNFDDPQYVTENPHVRAGLTRESIDWALSATVSGHWIPLTWLSLQLDATLSGSNAAGFHATNLALHVANSTLLFVVLSRMTGAIWPSIGVAALFAVHPLHVESVAWITERKGLLSTFFWLLAIAGYVRYVERPSLGRYVVVGALFVCGLCAKSMLVTLPITLLLLDFWPLRRFSERTIPRLIGEKLPLLAASIGFVLVSVATQSRESAMASLDLLPWKFRLMNAADAYLVYLWKTAYPLDLAVLYPHPVRNQSAIVSALAAACMAAITLWVGRRRRQQPYLLFGWLWFVVTLVPVIGLAQAGNQAWADRYTYVPLIGIFVACAWALADVVQSGRLSRRFATALCGVAFTSFAFCTWNQVGYWKNSITLWSHSIDVTGPNWQACDGLGSALLQNGRVREAIPVLRDVVALAPDYDLGHLNLGVALGMSGDPAAAKHEFEQAVRLNPGCIQARQNLEMLARELGPTGPHPGP